MATTSLSASRPRRPCGKAKNDSSQLLELVPRLYLSRIASSNNRPWTPQRPLRRCNTSVSDLTGKYQADFHPDESQLQKMLQDDQDVILKGETKFIPEEPFTDAQGNPHFLQTTKVPFQVPGDKTPAVLGISIDVTDKKRAEEALRENKSRLDLALRSASMGVWSLDLIENKRHNDDQVCRLLVLPRLIPPDRGGVLQSGTS